MTQDSLESLSRFDWQRLSTEVGRTVAGLPQAINSIEPGTDIEAEAALRQEIRSRVDARIRSSVMVHAPARLTALLVAELVSSGIRRIQLSANDPLTVTDLGSVLVRANVGHQVTTATKQLAQAIDPQAEIFSTQSALRAPFLGRHSLTILCVSYRDLLTHARDLVPEDAPLLPLIRFGNQVQVGPVTSALSSPCLECVQIALEPFAQTLDPGTPLRLPAESMLAALAADHALRWVDNSDRADADTRASIAQAYTVDLAELTVTATRVHQSSHCGCQLQLVQGA